MSSIADQLTSISAQIQSKVAQFLSCREILTNLKGKGDFVIQNEVNSLIRVQDQLEIELTQVLELIQQAKLGKISFDLVSSLLTQGPALYYKIDQQIRDTNSVHKLSGDTSSIGGREIPWKWIAIGLGLLLILRR